MPPLVPLVDGTLVLDESAVLLADEEAPLLLKPGVRRPLAAAFLSAASRAAASLAICRSLSTCLAASASCLRLLSSSRFL